VTYNQNNKSTVFTFLCCKYALSIYQQKWQRELSLQRPVSQLSCTKPLLSYLQQQHNTADRAHARHFTAMCKLNLGKFSELLNKQL